MLKVETKYGTLNLNLEGTWYLFDSDNKILFHSDNFEWIYSQLNRMNETSNIVEWLKWFDDVCWGSKQDCLNCAKDYAESNDREFDEKWALENLNRIGDTYILFEYSEAYL